MTTRRRAAPLLGAAAATTVVVTVAGVLLGPAASDPAPRSAKEPRQAQPQAEQLVERTAPEVPVPEVVDQRVADFVDGDDLPEGARAFDSGANQTGMTLSEGLLTHGAPEGPAAGFIETKLTSDVASLGARVHFPGADAGSVALVGWQSSLVQSREDFGPTPATGMRLVAGPGHWELSVVDDEVTMLGTGTYESVSGPATFQLLREGATLYVVDPTGAVTVIEDKRVAKLAGPWASWGLTETGPEQVPASIEAVWAG
jgi:hypothetical protein